MTRTLDQTDLDGAAVVRNVQALAPVFRERAEQAETDRVVPPESMAELVESGMLRLLVPKVFGGVQGTVRQLVDCIAAAATGCPATAWCAGQVAWSALVIGQFSLPAQQAVWGAGPNALTGSTAMGLTLQPAPGGYRVSGRGPFVSGGNYAQWYYPGAFIQREGQPPELRLFLIPRSAVTIVDTWHTVAMRGTGSNTVVIDDVFVPEHMTVPASDLREGTGPGGAQHGVPLFQLPWASVVPLIYTSVALGAARAAYNDTLENLRKKRTPAGKRTADSELIQVEIGMASAKLDTAELLIYRWADRADAGDAYPVRERAKVGRDTSYAMILLLEALDTVVRLSGTSAFGETSFLQQAWRDLHFAGAHQALDARITGGRFGQMELEVEGVASPYFY